MRLRILITILVTVTAMAPIVLLMENRVSSWRTKYVNLNIELIKARGKAKEAAEKAAQSNAAEEERLKQEHAELLKLRGEVAVLRKEREEWKLGPKGVVSAEEGQQKFQTMLQEKLYGNDYLYFYLRAPTAMKGKELGSLRRKMLNNRPLFEFEESLCKSLGSHVRAIEKSPIEFASFQTAFIASLLGWRDDPRASQIDELINRAAMVANERGYDYTAPGKNAVKWSEEQKALNQSVTATAQALLTPEERTVFDSAFIGILGIDYGIVPPVAN